MLLFSLLVFLFFFFFFFFFFNDTATTEIYTLSLHDALPISQRIRAVRAFPGESGPAAPEVPIRRRCLIDRSEEHTSELQSRRDLVCRLLLEKKKKKKKTTKKTQHKHNPRRKRL